MRIRITKSPLPKADLGGECPEGYMKDISGNCVPQLQLNTTQPNYAWTNFGSTPAPAPVFTQQQYRIDQNQGTPVTGSAPVVPINQKKPNNGVANWLAGPSKFLQNNPVSKAAFSVADTAMALTNAALPYAQMWDSKQKSNAVEDAYRLSLYNTRPVNPRNSRGDYEQNTGMVDPYNTGAKSKGQFANPYYTPMAQDGLSLGPIPFGDEPVNRNVFQYSTPLDFQPEMSAPAAPAPVRNVRSVEPASGSFKDFIAGKESGGDYKALPRDPKTGRLVSSAAGKYQFLWNSHKNWISKVTGVTTKEEFLNNPDAQERAFDYWDKNVLTPNAQKIKNNLGVPDSIEQIKAKIHFAGPGGAYKYYATGEETTDAFGTTTSTYTRQMGGENTESMKIRIISTPAEQMEYGGQMGHGLDLGGRRVYTDMPESMQESVSDTIGPVPREMATIEAERGETMLSDIDGDGQLEHMKIGGKRHSEGGTPLAAQPGSFIFSDTKKMKIKDPNVLALFGKSYKKGGYTPAALAKQYDLNKYKAILQDPNADPVDKRTAELMIANNEKKLGLLSVVQESKKNFPQGMPAVARATMGDAAYGGYIPRADEGMETSYLPYTNPFVSVYDPLDDIDPYGGGKTVKGSTTPEGVNNKYNRDPAWMESWGRIIPGFKDLPNEEAQKKSYEYMMANYPERVNAMWNQYGLTAKGMNEKDLRHMTTFNRNNKGERVFTGKFDKNKPLTAEQLKALQRAYVDGMPGVRQFDAPNVPAQGGGGTKWMCTPQGVKAVSSNSPMAMAGFGVYDSYEQAEAACKAAPTTTTTGGGGGGSTNTTEDKKTITTTSGNIPYGWTEQDINNYMLALRKRGRIQKFPSVRRDAPVAMPEFRNMDWRGRAAELQGMYNSQLDALGTYQSPASFAANASFMAGQQAEALSKNIDAVEQANVQGYNQMSAQQAALMNQALQQAAQNTFLRSQDRAILNQNFINSINAADTGETQAKNQGITNASGIYNTNITESPYYYFDPRFQAMRFNSDEAKAQYQAAMRNAGPNDGDMMGRYFAIRKELQGKVKDEELHEAVMDFMGMGKGSTGKTTATNYPMNPRMNRTTVQQPMYPQMQGMNPYAYNYQNPYLMGNPTP